jgi:hypothetical protein
VPNYIPPYENVLWNRDTARGAVSADWMEVNCQLHPTIALLLDKDFSVFIGTASSKDNLHGVAKRKYFVHTVFSHND